MNVTLQWCHNEHDGFSKHQPHDCLLNRLFRSRSKKTSKLSITGLCEGYSPVIIEFPVRRASNAENAAICWPHHDISLTLSKITYFHDSFNFEFKSFREHSGTVLTLSIVGINYSIPVHSLRPHFGVQCHSYVTSDFMAFLVGLHSVTVIKVIGHALGIWNSQALTHWGRDKMAGIFQTTFSNQFSWMKICKFRLRFHWSLFPRVRLTIFHHWFR